MKRKIFFSFHYERDAWRAGQVRNSNVIASEDEHGFIDAVDWEEIKRKGDESIKAWIRNQLEDTSATVVLIGTETSQRPWVDFEIRESWKRGNAIVGLCIHNVKDIEGKPDMCGVNPLASILLANNQSLSGICETYDWTLDNGRANLGTWADQAVEARENYRGETTLKEDSDWATSSTRDVHTNSGPTIINNPARPWAP